MCSIAGTTGANIKTILEVMKHRSPDDEGYYSDKDIKLGMGRLKILDLVSKGLCPYQEDNFVLCYNGEIYNYIELRSELKTLGWNFQTTSDTEVLMKSWRQWGFGMFAKLNGMFAFAIYDVQKKQLLLARDIAGEKPLYYYKKGKTFAFASEAKALSGLPGLTLRPSQFYEAFQHCLYKTLWEEIHALPPANYLVYDIPNDRMEVKPYWELQPRSINPKTAQDELEALLEDAVKIRTRSDVPYGLYYSGGIDSSLLSTFHKFHKQFYFDDQQDWKDDFFKMIDKIVWHLDFPVGSLSSYPLWKLAERASKEVKVVISGEGADELFGGYVRYLPVAREWELRRNFRSYHYLFNRYFPNYIDGFTKITARNDNHDYVLSLLEPHFGRFEDPINAMGFADFKLILPSLLQMGDRMAGAFGIENRCPFLDRRVIEFGFSLPPELKINGLEQKIILRRLLEKRGIVKPLKEEKKGLTIIFNKWLNTNDWDRRHYFKLLKNRWMKMYGGGEDMQNESIHGDLSLPPILHELLEAAPERTKS